jgi:hypothetical protein
MWLYQVCRRRGDRARSAWQNPFVERFIGPIRHECPDYVIVFNELHLRHVLSSYFQYDHEPNTSFPEQGLSQPRLVQPPSAGKIVPIPLVGGLNHRYKRRAA